MLYIHSAWAHTLHSHTFFLFFLPFPQRNTESGQGFERKKPHSEAAQDFVDYIMSSDGQKIVSDSGYVTVSENAAYSGKKPSGKISVAGSSSVSPVMEKLAEAYQKVNTNAKVEIQTSDSSAGMQAAMGGTCDIGMASRDLKDEEKSALKVETIAKDGIAVIVNNANTCDDLTLDQVKSIYTGETTVWSDIIK